MYYYELQVLQNTGMEPRLVKLESATMGSHDIHLASNGTDRPKTQKRTPRGVKLGPKKNWRVKSCVCRVRHQQGDYYKFEMPSMELEAKTDNQSNQKNGILHEDNFSIRRQRRKK